MAKEISMIPYKSHLYRGVPTAPVEAAYGAIRKGLENDLRRGP